MVASKHQREMISIQELHRQTKPTKCKERVKVSAHTQDLRPWC
jgi:hypothetical protein